MTNNFTRTKNGGQGYTQPKQGMFDSFVSGVRGVFGGNSLANKLDKNRQITQNQLDQIK